MKKRVLTLAIIAGAMVSQLGAQVRYVNNVFTDAQVKVTKNILYSENHTVLYGGPPFKLDSLYMDIYEPTGDAVAARPLIIYCHTGSFLPRYINKGATGAKNDSATVEMCMQFAKKGYVVASIAYRLGWNPAAPTQDDRASSIINAAYKGVQDLSCAVRYFKANQKNGGNTYGVDSTKICVGGQGTGGYVTMAFAGVTKQSEIKIAKFFNFTTNKAYVNDTLWGDRMGFNATAGFGKSNYVGHTSNAHVAFNIGGAMGDTSWMEAGEIPLICIHPINDPFAPYTTGIVKVPGTNINVVQVSGGYDIMKKQNLLGNNAVYKGKVNDRYTVRANQINDGLEGLFPIAGIQNSSAPWEWWDTVKIKMLPNPPYDPATIVANGKATNPFMSKARALLYIDTLQGYLAPRIAVSLGLVNSVGINDAKLSSNINVFPNPATNGITIVNNWNDKQLLNISLADVTGKVVYSAKVDNNRHLINTEKMKPGMYVVTMKLTEGTATTKIIIQ